MATIVKKKNKKTAYYKAIVRLSGFPTQIGMFDKLKDAKEWAVSRESDLRQQRYHHDGKAKKYSVGDLIDQYIEKILYTKTTKKRYIEGQHQQLKWWNSRIGKLRLDHLTQYVINEQKDQLRSNHSAGTVNRYLAALSHVLTIAVKEWGWLSHNPMQHIQKLKEPPGRVRFLSDQERHRLLEACKQEKRKPLYLIVMLAISTGARKSEILTCKWENVDFERKVITIHETKNNESRALFCQ